jgi:hypothetical protein
MTPPLPPLIWISLTGLNLLFQVFDGVLTYEVMHYGVGEANPLVAAAIGAWGAVWGLVFWKLLACTLLCTIFAMRHRLQMMGIKALALTAAVYGPVVFLSFCELVLQIGK